VAVSASAAAVLVAMVILPEFMMMRPVEWAIVHWLG
jgi:hypothetical protein